LTHRQPAVRFPDGLPDAAALTACLRATPRSVSGGHPLRFVPPPKRRLRAAHRRHRRGADPPDDWHDFFNALAWCVWPRSKAACNALHLPEQAPGPPPGWPAAAARDALTQFDECGVLVVSADPEISALLAAHAWEAAFWQRRARLGPAPALPGLRPRQLGPAARALLRPVRQGHPPAGDGGLAALPVPARQAEADAWLAAHLAARTGPSARPACRRCRSSASPA
jgi:hypothetical protein